MENNEVQFDYRVKAVQNENRISRITAAEVETSIECATPPEFPHGIAGVWSPETFFLASIAGCYVNTYQALCDRFKMQPVSIECEASGTVALVEGRYRFTGVMLNPIITVSNYDDEAKAITIIEKAHKYCLISNSVNCPVSVSENVMVLV
ncbi:MAG TPA: osmotically inducible protein OsmC [Saprospirales bacterium]|nr:osmotically inducible protein OsmC [Saprospirales bacterium]